MKSKYSLKRARRRARPLRHALGAALILLLAGGAAQAQGGTTGVKIFKDVSGGDPMTGTLFEVHLDCSTTPFSTTVNVPAGTYVEILGVPAPNTCVVTEDPALPAPPAGYAWETTTTPPAPITLAVVAGEESLATIFNRLVVGVPVATGSLAIRKTVVGGDATGSVFEMTVLCTSPEFGATVTVPANQQALVSGIPAPNSCTITESPSLPAPPPGYAWDAELTPPSPLSVSVPAGVIVSAVVTNTLRGIPPGGGATPPTSLPGLGQLGLALLSVALGLAARRALRALR